jgi:hypothetical protein
LLFYANVADHYFIWFAAINFVRMAKAASGVSATARMSLSEFSERFEKLTAEFVGSM